MTSLALRWLGSYFLSPLVPASPCDSWLTDSISLQIGISAILFPIVIFIVELAGDSDGEVLRKSEVLLRGTFLFPVTMLTIFLLSETAYYHSLPCAWTFVLVSTLSSAGIFYRTIQLSLSPEKMRTISQKLLKERVILAVSSAVRQRIQNNILFSELARIGGSMEYFNTGEGLMLYASRTGYVQDVDLRTLCEIISLVDEDNRSKIKGAERSATIENTDSHPVKGPRVSLTTRVGYKLEDDIDSKCILVVNPEPKNLSQKSIQKLKELANEAVIVGEVTDHEETFVLQLNRLKDYMLECISAKRTAAIDSCISDYVSVMEFFLQRLSRFQGAIHSAERASEELHQIGGGWSIVDIVGRHLSEFSIRALQTEDFEVIKRIASAPISIAAKSTQWHDHYLFQHFISYPVMTYRYAQENASIKIKGILIDRSWRYLKELADYRIERLLNKKHIDEHAIKDLKHFALEILVVFQNLMRSAIDFNDSASLKLFASAQNDLFNHFHPSQDIENVERIELFLQRLSMDSNATSRLKDKMQIQQAKEEAEKAILERKRVILFGLQAWVLRYVDKNQHTDDHRTAMATLSGHLAGLSSQEITDVFVSSMNVEESGRLGWEWWELETRPSGVTHRMEFSDYLQKLYAIYLLRIYRADQALPRSHYLAGLVHGTQSKIRQMLEEIRTDYSRWEWMLPSGSSDRVSSLLASFDLMEEAQKAAEDKELIAAPLSKNKVIAFENGFLKGYERFSGLHALLQKASAIKYDLDTMPNLQAVPAWGFNEVFDKEAFVEDAVADYDGIAEQYGETMARDENANFLASLSRGLENYSSDKQQLSGLPGLVKLMSEKLRTRGVDCPAILTSLDYSDLALLKATDEFIPSHSKKCPKDSTAGYIGVFKYSNENIIPVYSPPLRPDETTLKGIVCVCSLAKLGTATYYSAATNSAEKAYCRGKFMIKVIDLNANEAERMKLLAANPPWLSTYPDKEGYLRKRTILMIFERLKVDFTSAQTAGYVINIAEDAL